MLEFERLRHLDLSKNHGRCKQRDFSHSLRVGAKGSGRMTKNISKLTSNAGRKIISLCLLFELERGTMEIFRMTHV